MNETNTKRAFVKGDRELSAISFSLIISVRKLPHTTCAKMGIMKLHRHAVTALCDYQSTSTKSTCSSTLSGG